MAFTTVFSLYIILSYGFEYFSQPNFSLEFVNRSSSLTLTVGDTATLICRADSYWEWCRWVHLDTYCEWEWLSASAGSLQTGCNMAKVELAGNYSRFECGLTFIVQPASRGVWLCELEKYHLGFERRYGEVRHGEIRLSVVSARHSPTELPLTTQDRGGGGGGDMTERNIVNITQPPDHQEDNEGDSAAQEEREIYQRNFLILRILVRSGVVITLILLSLAFLYVFVSNWKVYEVGLQGRGGEGRESKRDTRCERDSTKLLVANTLVTAVLPPITTKPSPSENRAEAETEMMSINVVRGEGRMTPTMPSLTLTEIMSDNLTQNI